MITVRDLITNAMAEARLVNRSQPIPGNLFIDAFSLLKKRLDQYSNTNYLSFVRKEANFDATKGVTLIGTLVAKDDYKVYIVNTEADLPDASKADKGSFAYVRYTQTLYTLFGAVSGSYQWMKVAEGEEVAKWPGWAFYPDVEVDNLQEVMRCYVRPKNSDTEEYLELRFVAYEDFYDYSCTNEVYSILPIDDEHVKLFLKKPMSNMNVKLMYNEAFDFGPDDELNIPRQFISLFTAGLVYDLAIQYPRLSDSTVSLLKDRLTELEANVRRSSSVNKFLGRTLQKRSWSYADGLAGRFLYG